uniref:Uncharacterized protein n=1 Tax=Rhizophora mucronata TaxID=61149 RepID=A0A2P2Q917_RHIMU
MVLTVLELEELNLSPFAYRVLSPLKDSHFHSKSLTSSNF